MASTGAGNGGLQTGISLTGISSLAYNATAPGATAAFTIPYVTGASAALCDRCNVQIATSSWTPTAGDYLQGVFLVSNDGTSFTPAWVANKQLFPTSRFLFTYPLNAAATTLIMIEGLELPSTAAATARVELALFYASTGTTSITVSSITLYPYGAMVG